MNKRTRDEMSRAMKESWKRRKEKSRQEQEKNQGNGRREEAIAFLYSGRGQFVMGQALQVAIENADHNIDEMVLLRDELFPLYVTARQMSLALREGLKETRGES